LHLKITKEPSGLFDPSVTDPKLWI